MQLRSFIRALGVGPDWVDDIAQEAFLVAWREFESYDQQRDYGKWLRGIARNLIRNEVRKQQRHKRLLHKGLTQLLLSSTEAQPRIDAVTNCRVSVLRDCIEKLAPKSRKLVAGRYCDGWKAPDLADHFGMTATAVRKALSRIRQQLRECIDLQIEEG